MISRLPSKTKLVLFLFSFLEASAFHCRRHGILSPSSPSAFSSTLEHPPVAKRSSRLSASLSEKFPGTTRKASSGPNKKRKCRCPDDADDSIDSIDNQDPLSSLEDRREAIFAMMGSLWATSSAVSMTAFPEPARATAGVDANMAFPDVMAGLNDRNTKQCLVESLGNRECLVYKETDPDKLLYKGVDTGKLVERIRLATSALAEIPPLVERKKWNEITGILTGPMGELSSTLNLLAGTDARKTKLARKVKEDLFGMGTATTQRQTDVILKYHALAIKDLAVFLEAAL
mmetsp:Transcript_10053/g.29652  ORF Transcript_10053/g.29652 Transcript_10053/m.29652 type:complete len:288 (+) Transcript_10053:164-1027(+)|eukprot:CAMPEP_0172372604 /NCGR_PEP_ID=MMETSP1060-20121228/48434_1 /TAXON_ID=37318 /ORGANISM="Pseudo-nitzschia pungens, Strain cf. cingulata" /LENGTH=287 /DNA_ID=CAMNT_0013098675 /DNA_START=151 /DNA_END=1014 /DNA_ORIENTATION=-